MEKFVTYQKSAKDWKDKVILLTVSDSINKKIPITHSTNYLKSHTPIIWSDFFKPPGTPRDFLLTEITNRCKRYLAVGSPIFKLGTGLSRRYWSKIGLNGYDANANFNNLNSPSDRWEKMVDQFEFDVLPWRKSGTHIAVLVDIPYSHLTSGTKIYKWARETVNEIRTHTDRPIKIWLDPEWSLDRHFEKNFKPLENVEICTNDLIFDDCWASVSYRSYKAADSLIHGVPNISLGTGNFFFDGKLENIENIELPDRDQWFHNIAYTQWNIEEIKNKEFMEHLGIEYG